MFPVGRAGSRAARAPGRGLRAGGAPAAARRAAVGRPRRPAVRVGRARGRGLYAGRGLRRGEVCPSTVRGFFPGHQILSFILPHFAYLY